MGQDESLPLYTSDFANIRYENQGLTEIPFYLDENSQISSISLGFNKINKFPLVLNNLEFLDLRNNNLGMLKLDDIMFKFDKLKTLRLSNNGFNVLLNHISNFKSLVNLYMDFNELSDDSDFSNLEKLKCLDLFLNKFTKIPKIPDGLEIINVGFNSIKTVDFNAESIVELRLAGNDITEISENCFFPSLNLLDLSLNRLVEFPNLKKIAPNIEKFFCSFNFLRTTPNALPKSLTNLNLSNNILTELNISFDDLQELVQIDISKNKIKVIPKLPRNLESLNAQFNNINEITDPLAFIKLPSLKFSSNLFTSIPDLHDCQSNSLSLKNNKINQIDTQNIPSTIQHIDFTNNLISVIPITIVNFNFLKSLNLTLNKIKEIPKEIVSLKLTTLQICENDISDLPELPSTLNSIIAFKCNFSYIPKSVYKLKRLFFIDFSDNSISSLVSLPDAQNINLSSNKITKIPQISDNIKILNLSINQIKNFEIQESENLILQELDLSHNKLKKFETGKLLVLNTLNLSYNPKLKLKLSFDNYPVIKIIDIVQTHVSLVTKIPNNINALITSNPHISQQYKTHEIRYYNTENVGYSETRGQRQTMEDTLIIRRNFTQGMDIFAVIDGHGGVKTASLAAYYIPLLFSEIEDKSMSGFSSVIRSLNDYLRDNSVKDGAVLVFTIITHNEIGCAHLGDSRALVIHKDYKIIQLTYDHKAVERSEIDLVKENRSYVESYRTAGVLEISRSIGDFNIPGISHVPDMTNYPRTLNDYRLVLGCDGIFDVLTNEEVGKIVVENPDVDYAAYLLKSTAYSRGSTDNISAVVIDIEKK